MKYKKDQFVQFKWWGQTKYGYIREILPPFYIIEDWRRKKEYIVLWSDVIDVTCVDDYLTLFCVIDEPDDNSCKKYVDDYDRAMRGISCI